MTVRFSTSDGKLHDSGLCDRNLNLLAHAQCIELDIGSICGGHGVCGKDRVKLSPEAREQVSPITEEEREHLSEAELADGWRLGCQCFPEENGTEVVAQLVT